MEKKFNSFNTFVQLTKDQFIYGGKKYAHSNEKEATDVLFKHYGKNWLLGTIDKYTFRFKTCKREKDLLKIACYMFILWLKRGFFVIPQGINDPPIDTNIDIKTNEFSKFIKRTEKYFEINVERTMIKNEVIKLGMCYPYGLSQEEGAKYWRTDTWLINSISNLLVNKAKKDFRLITEMELIDIFFNAYILWDRNFKDKAGQDCDTWNEDSKKPLRVEFKRIFDLGCAYGGGDLLGGKPENEIEEAVNKFIK